MITYTRGRIRIVDLAKMPRSARECNAAINAHYDRIFDPSGLRLLTMEA